MPLEYILTSQSTTYNVQSSDDVFVMDGVNITSINDAIEANFLGVNNGITVTVRGGLYGRTAIDLWENSTENNDAWIYVAAGAHLHGTEDGIAIRQGDDNVVINYGEISAQQAGVYFQGGEATVHNHGAITSFGNGGQGAVIFNATADGTNIRELVNTGIISGAPQSTGTSLYSTIQNSSGAEFHFNNSGTIEGIGARAVYSSALQTFFDNSGDIIGNISISNTASIENSGEISGNVTSTGLTDMVNSGLISGDVTFSGTADIYTGLGNGVITGTLNMGSGDDEATLGHLGGAVYGEFGNDTLFGGSGVDFIDGGVDNDRLYGRGGDDDLRGDLGSDYLSAGAGDDYVEGADGADKLFGSTGDDTLQGGRDRDTIRGGDGEDEINGGRNADILRGGAGADVFLYQFRQDSTTTQADTIQDFQVGIDQIDLGMLNVAYIGSTAFSGTGQEVRYEIGVDDRTFVEVDTDGTGSANMRINLTTVGALIEDDFIL